MIGVVMYYGKGAHYTGIGVKLQGDFQKQEQQVLSEARERGELAETAQEIRGMTASQIAKCLIEIQGPTDKSFLDRTELESIRWSRFDQQAKYLKFLGAKDIIEQYKQGEVNQNDTP